MGLISVVAKRARRGLRSSSPLSLDDWTSYFSFGGLQYPFAPQMTMGEAEEYPQGSFDGYVRSLYKANGVVFACMAVRMLLFSEARFQYRRLESGRPGNLFGDTSLLPLEKPWSGGTTGDLLARAIQDADIAGNFYAMREGSRIHRMRPDWVTIILGSQSEPDDPALAIDAEVVAYAYQPGGPLSSAEAKILLPEQVCHFAPIPDPCARFRGMSWLTPVIREVMGDQAATKHKLRYFEKGATKNLAVMTDKAVTGEKFKEFVKLFKEEHADLTDAYRTIFLGGGASIEGVGADLQEADFKIVQAAGETRIAAAAGTPPVIVGLSEGLQSATYANYGQARRRFADGTMRPLWRNACGSFAQIVTPPKGAELWYDDRDIAFLQEDEKDAADILEVQSRSIKGLVEAGFEPGSAVAAVISGDMNKLQHTGMLSVQMQPPGRWFFPNGSSTRNGSRGEPIGAHR